MRTAVTPRGVPATTPISTYPACAIDEYASIRFRLDCVSAAKLPAVIVTIDSVSNRKRQSTLSPGNPSRKIRSSIANDAALEPTDRNAVTGVGAPSYTSGAHMWKGTAAILNPTPATTRITARINRGSPSWPVNNVAIFRRFVVPESPYINDIPYSRIPSENAPRRKYLTAASFERWLGLMNPVRM